MVIKCIIIKNVLKEDFICVQARGSLERDDEVTVEVLFSPSVIT